jgi:divalent metal cation (Fe/Co/Zn/Cd) transporter
LLDKISQILSRNRRPNWVDIHRLRAIHSGDLLHIDFHLLLPRDLSFQEAHEEIEIARSVLMDNLEGYTDVNVHGDPCDPEDCPACDREPCDDRSAPASFRPVWNGETTSKWAEAHTSETKS